MMGRVAMHDIDRLVGIGRRSDSHPKQQPAFCRLGIVMFVPLAADDIGGGRANECSNSPRSNHQPDGRGKSGSGQRCSHGGCQGRDDGEPTYQGAFDSAECLGAEMAGTPSQRVVSQLYDRLSRLGAALRGSEAQLAPRETRKLQIIDGRFQRRIVFEYANNFLWARLDLFFQVLLTFRGHSALQSMIE